MKNAFNAGIDFLKKKGIRKTIIRIIEWIPEYIICRYPSVRAWIYKHGGRCKGRIKFSLLKERLKVDSYIIFSHIEAGLEYCQRIGQAYTILNDGEQIEVVQPKCFEAKDDIKITLFDSPPIYLTTFTDVEIYGATNLISKEDIALNNMFDRDKGKNRYDLEVGCLISCHRKGKYICVAYKQTDMIVDEAIYCVGWACNNYYHFTVEILSRLVFIDQYEEYRSLPVLVDSGALNIPQMKDLFDRVNIYHHPIIPIEEYHRVHINRLVYVSRNYWLPANLKPGIIAQKEDFLISRSVADNIRSRILPIQKKSGNIIYKKIFLSRKKCAVPRLVNIDEIEQIFLDNGYHIVYPEELTFDEEVEIFHGADIIVGVAGGAFTNIIYCHEGAKIGIITAAVDGTYCFSNIANMINTEFIAVRADGRVQSFILDAGTCLRFIEFLNK